MKYPNKYSQHSRSYAKALNIQRLRAWLLYLGTLVLGMALGALLVAFFLAGDIYDYQDTVDGVHLPKVDAIVCLAGGRGRIAASGDIWYRYWELSHNFVKGLETNPVLDHLPLLYISGMGHQSNWNVFARQLRRGVLGVITQENVILETESENTEMNAAVLSRFAKQHGWERILLMTSPYHMKRARFIFEKTLRSLVPSVGVETLTIYQEPFEPGEWRTDLHSIRVTLLEYVKWVYYRLVWGK